MPATRCVVGAGHARDPCGSAFMPTRDFPNAVVAMNGDPQGSAVRSGGSGRRRAAQGRADHLLDQLRPGGHVQQHLATAVDGQIVRRWTVLVVPPTAVESCSWARIKAALQ